VESTFFLFRYGVLICIPPIKLLIGPFSINDYPIVFFLFISAAFEISNNYSVNDLLIFSKNLSLKFFIFSSRSIEKSFAIYEAEKFVISGICSLS
jgi:hypothetical protein